MLNVFHSQDLRMRSRASFFKGTGALGTLFGYNFVPSSLPTRMRHGGEDSGPNRIFKSDFGYPVGYAHALPLLR